MAKSRIVLVWQLLARGLRRLRSLILSPVIFVIKKISDAAFDPNRHRYTINEALLKVANDRSALFIADHLSECLLFETDKEIRRFAADRANLVISGMPSPVGGDNLP